jgi:hypothetical protein
LKCWFHDFQVAGYITDARAETAVHVKTNSKYVP